MVGRVHDTVIVVRMERKSKQAASVRACRRSAQDRALNSLAQAVQIDHA